MISFKHVLFVLLLATISCNAIYAQGKNSFSYQSGVLNHFYDESPVFINTRALKNTNHLRGYLNSALIRSRSLNYSRTIGSKSNISLTGGTFRAYFDQGSDLNNNPRIAVSNRNWRFVAIEFNRSFISNNRIDFFLGGGLIYKKGYEVYMLNNYGHYWSCTGDISFSAVENLGGTLNINTKYRFKKRLFFSAKLDAQYYGFEFERAKTRFTEMQNEFSSRNFPKTKKLNHTLTIGVGVNF